MTDTYLQSLCGQAEGAINGDVITSLAAELLEARAKLRRVEAALDGQLAKFEADLAEYAPVEYGQCSPSLCVGTARSMIRTALENPTHA